jgi:hypothetical protein
MAAMRAFGILATTAMVVLLVMWFATFSPRSNNLFTDNGGTAHAAAPVHTVNHGRHIRREA